MSYKIEDKLVIAVSSSAYSTCLSLIKYSESRAQKPIKLSRKRAWIRYLILVWLILLYVDFYPLIKAFLKSSRLRLFFFPETPPLPAKEFSVRLNITV